MRRILVAVVLLVAILPAHADGFDNGRGGSDVPQILRPFVGGLVSFDPVGKVGDSVAGLDFDGWAVARGLAFARRTDDPLLDGQAGQCAGANINAAGADSTVAAVLEPSSALQNVSGGAA